VVSEGFSDSLFALLRDLIHERTGILYGQNSRDLLAHRVSARMVEVGFGSFLDYYYLLKYDAAADAEWEQLLNVLTIRETFFWREIDQVHALVQVLAPLHAAERPGLPLRIWSAACASGEEPLTIAIALQEAGWFGKIPVELYASDISSQAIAQAQTGIYPERSFRAIPPAIRARYFQQAAKGWRVDSKIQAKVQWQMANVLAGPGVMSSGRASVIFCRNMFIYFSEAAIKRTVRMFFERLETPGYLFVGVSEPLLRLATDFELREIGGAFVYVKER
jgi:chemotaxis protein methyltransferase CheR